MYDLRQTKIIDLDKVECLKDDTTYKFEEKITGKNLIAKLISYYEDSDDIYLISEFKKLALLSGEPEIATVYYLATGKTTMLNKSCYIMEFIEGQSLQSFLDSRPSIIYEVLLDFALQLASGLEKAHNFEIFHNDLHNENIMINNFSYLKIIDFLWLDYNLPKETKQKKDIEDFKRIINEFYLKCRESDKIRFKIISDYCQNIKTFKGLKKEIEMLDLVSFDVSLIKEKSLPILSTLFELTTLNDLHMSLESRDELVPDIHIPALDTKEERYLKNINDGTKIKYIDTRESRIQENLYNQFSPKLYSLKQVGLIDWSLWVTNSGETFVGPYKYNLRIWFTSKFLKWKKINELMQFIDNNSNTDLEGQLLE